MQLMLTQLYSATGWTSSLSILVIICIIHAEKCHCQHMKPCFILAQIYVSMVESKFHRRRVLFMSISDIYQMQFGDSLFVLALT